MAAALFSLSVAAAGKVEVIGDTSHGTVTSTANGAVVTVTITPAEGYYIRKSDITATKTFMPMAAPRRSSVPIADELTLVGADPEDLSQARTYTITLPSEEYDILLDVKYFTRNAITESMVSLSETVFVYNEKVQCPTVFVRGLTENKDYTLSYSNPNSLETGEYTVTVKGISAWKGTITRTYKIFAGGKAEVNNNITGGTIATAVDGLTVTLTVTPANGYYIRKQDVIVAKTFMPVTASRHSAPVADHLTLTGEDPDDLSLPRTYTAQLPGWEYSAYADATFTKRNDITSAMVKLSASSFVYNGSDQKPVVTVTGLTEGKDYLLDFAGTSWSDVGTYSLTVTGRSTWKNVVTKTYTITKAPSVVTVTPEPLSLTYTGASQTLIAAGDAIGGTLLYSLDNSSYQTTLPTRTAAGSYTVYYKVQGDHNHKDTEAKTVTVTIAKKAITISGVTAQDKVFDRTTVATLAYDDVVYGGIVNGDALTITAKGTFADANVGTNKQVTITALTLGGTSIANYQLAAEGQQTTTTAAITPKGIEDATIADIPSATYTGDAITPEVSVTLDGVQLISGTDFSVSYADNINVGTATATVTGQGNYQGAIQKNFTISKAPSVITLDPRPSTLDYTGEAQALVVAGEAAGGTMLYSLDGELFAAEIPTSTATGSYTVYYKVQGDANHEDTEAQSIIAVIGKKDITISGILAQDKVYDGTTAVTLNYDAVIFGGIVEGDMLTITATGVLADANVGSDKVVTLNGLTLGGTNVDNYQLAANGQQETATASITKKDIFISGISAQDKVYDGTTAATLVYDNVVFGGIVNGDDLTVTAKGTFVDAGVGTDKEVTITELTLSGTSIANYQLAESGQQTTATAAIIPKSIDVAIISDIPAQVYSGEAITPEFTVTFDGVTLQSGADYTTVFADNVEVGTATITVTGMGIYQGSVQKNFTISKAPSVITFDPQPLTLDYTGEAQALVVAGEAEGGTMVYSLDGELFTTELPNGTDAGVYTVSYKVQGDNNHSDTEVFTLKSSITPTLADESGNELDADFIESEGGDIVVIINSLPDDFWENTSTIPSTVSDEEGNVYDVTLICAEAFDDMPSDIIVVLPEGMSTTEGVTNVINGDGTCETLDLTGVSGYDIPIDVVVETVVYDREVDSDVITVCLPYSIDIPEDVTAYELNATDSEGVSFVPVTGNTLEAYQPYLLRLNEDALARLAGAADSAVTLNLGAKNVTIAPVQDDVEVSAGVFRLCGTVRGLTHAEGLERVAYVMQSDDTWIMTASSAPEDADKPYLGAFQVYMQMVGGDGTEVISAEMEEGVTTIISNPLQTSPWGGLPTPSLGRAGEGSHAWYDLMGRKLPSKPTKKGLYIYQGKKVNL